MHKANHVQAQIERIVDMRYSEFVEDDNEVEDAFTAGNRIRLLSKDNDTIPNAEVTSQSQKVSHATKRECVIPSRSRYELSAKERFVCALDNEGGINKKAALQAHHSR